MTTGTEAADVLGPSPLDDYVRGLGGDDMIRGGPGNDLLTGDAGNDTLNGNEGSDVVFGGDGDDTVLGGSGDDFVSGGDGRDLVNGGGGSDRIVGGPGDDVLFGASDTFEDGSPDWYLLDGLGHDEIVEETDGSDDATCAAGVYIIARRFEGPDLLLEFNTGGSVLVRNDRVERILGCDCP